MRFKTLFPVLLLALLLTGCEGQTTTRAEEHPAITAAGESTRAFFAMDTYMQIRAFGASDELLDAAEAWVEELERLISVTDAGSELYAVNQTGTGRLSSEPAELLRQALGLCEETEGALDVTVYPVVRAWGFTTGEYRVPRAEELEELLKAVDYRQVELDNDGNVLVPHGTELDLGSVAKGFVGDRLVSLLREAGVKSALLDLGGNIQALGAKPDGSDWRIGIQDPKGDGLLGILRIRDCAVITSGGYERYFEDEAGNLWWHIMDPKTGRPAQSGLISVTVMGPEGLVCDALSTALFVMGEKGALEYWRTHREVELALVTADGRLVLTPGLAERFTPDAALAYDVEAVSG